MCPDARVLGRTYLWSHSALAGGGMGDVADDVLDTNIPVEKYASHVTDKNLWA